MSAELVEYLKQNTGFSESTVETVFESFCKYVQISLRQGKEIRIKGFGNFSVKDIPERQARNPRTGEEFIASPKRKPIFKFGKTFVESVQPDEATEESLPTSSIPLIPQISLTPTPPVVVQPPVSVPPVVVQSPLVQASVVVPPPVPVELLGKNWFANINGTTVEIPEKELINRGIDANTPLWSQETGWKLAKDIESISYLFSPPPY